MGQVRAQLRGGEEGGGGERGAGDHLRGWSFSHSVSKDGDHNKVWAF